MRRSILDRPVKIVCVLNKIAATGKGEQREYVREHVDWLEEMIRRNVTVPYEFECLDNEVMSDAWPGWWAKIELFRHYRGKTFYLDLDTTLTGNIDKFLLYPHRFTALRPLNKLAGARMNSGVMAWDGDYSFLYERFKENAELHMSRHTTAKSWGDQGFIGHHVGDVEYFQDIFPGGVVSGKLDLKWRPPASDRVRIVCWHGPKKPWKDPLWTPYWL